MYQTKVKKIVIFLLCVIIAATSVTAASAKSLSVPSSIGYSITSFLGEIFNGIFKRNVIEYVKISDVYVSKDNSIKVYADDAEVSDVYFYNSLPGSTVNTSNSVSTEPGKEYYCVVVLSDGHVSGAKKVTIHSHSYKNQTVLLNATCTQDGQARGTCSCGDTKLISIPATGHNFAEYISNNDATCTQDGTMTATCGICGYEQTVTEKGTATGHNYVVQGDFDAYRLDDNTDVTAYLSGYSAATKGTSLSVSVSSVDKTSVTVEVSGITSSTKTQYVFVRIGSKQVSEVIPAGSTQTTRTMTIDECGNYIVPKLCNAGGKLFMRICTKCSNSYYFEVKSTGHDLETTTKSLDPTCTEDGYYIKTQTCKNCGESWTTANFILVALGHTAVTDPAVAATCTEDGLTEGSHCSVCGTVLTAQEVVPATGHSFTDYVQDSVTTYCSDTTETFNGTTIKHSFGTVQSSSCSNMESTTVTTSTFIDGGDDGVVGKHGMSQNRADLKEIGCTHIYSYTASGSTIYYCNCCEVETKVTYYYCAGHTTTGNTETAKCDNCDATDTRTISETTQGKATVLIYVYDDDHQSKTDYVDLKTITIDEGSSYSMADVYAAAGYSSGDALVRSGSAVTNAVAGQTYTFEVDT